MCGIVGIFGLRDKAKSLELTTTMCDLIKHRGPDAQGVWQNDTVTLGHRRLSIIDVSEAGNQPFFSHDKKLAIVFNGEIYNYLELKNELSEFTTFYTQTDTEVILAAYQKWGIHCVERFFGMFGFALWDNDLQKLYIVRDRLGIKPIYYSIKGSTVIFASEIRPILSTGMVEKKIGRAALEDYLRYQTVHAPNTIVDDVKMLMPGHIMELSEHGITQTKFWSVVANANQESKHHDADTVKKNVREILQSAVDIRMRADVPFGAFLSGGIDSSAVVGLMSNTSSHKVKTFAVTFYEKEFDESPYSSLIAKKFNTDHTEIKLSAVDFLKLVPDALMAMDHPSGDGPNTYVVSKVTREQGVKMALSGLGGDEVFAGYDIFKRMKKLEAQQWLNLAPLAIRKMGGALLQKFKPSVAADKIAMSLASDKMDFQHLYPIARQLFSESQIQLLLNTKGEINNPLIQLCEHIAQADLEMLSKVSAAEMTTYMQNVLLRDTDQMSMAHALEVRVPFLDHRLVEYVMGVGDNIKYPHTAKQLLTESLGDLIPRDVIDRPKMGFTFPWAVWMKNELKSFCEENLEALKNIEALNFNEVQNLWNRFQLGDPHITWSRMWPLVALGHWVKQNNVR